MNTLPLSVSLRTRLLVPMRDKDDPSVLVMPAQFMPVAEKSGKILDIDRWVLREAIQMLGAGRRILSRSTACSSAIFPATATTSCSSKP